jgi:predicted Zn-ribbon and HTH transcriptional regulator
MIPKCTTMGNNNQAVETAHATEEKDEQSMNDVNHLPVCSMCNFEMHEIQRCHLRCPNCGSELTCSDVW